MIIKISRSLFPAPDKRVLIYNKDKTLLHEEEMSPDILKLFGEGELKIYHRATLDSGGQLDIHERVEDRAW